VDKSTASFPKSGTCINLRTHPCDDNSEVNCFENDDLWGVCPYCRAFKHHEDHGGELSLGKYAGGEGDFLNDDPMRYTGGSDENCDGVERTSDVYWYCWYDVNDDIVSLDHIYTLWIEDPLCHYLAYVYTPLACPWALPSA